MLPKNIPINLDIENEYSIEELDQLINSLAIYKTQITIQEIFNSQKSDYIDKFIERIKADNRFIVIWQEDIDELLILPFNTLLNFLCRLNIRLGRLGIGGLPKNTLESFIIISLLKTNNKKSAADLIKKAEKLSLLEIDGQYVFFPLADVFNMFYRIMHHEFYGIVEIFIKNEDNKRKIRKSDIIKIISLAYPADKKSTYDKRNFEIILYRFGLRKSKKITLEEIGARYGLTRERVRQIIKRELNRIKKNSAIKKALIEIILQYFMTNKTKKIFYLKKGKEDSIIKLTSSILDIDIYEIAHLNLFYICFNQSEKKLIKRYIKLKNRKKSFIDIVNEVDKTNSLFLSKKDIYIIKKQELKKRSKYKIRKELILKAMEKIGRPAHYVDIANECNKLCSNIKLTPKEVLIVLTTKSKDKEEWTWTGRRGYYALKKWGYKRPKEDLFSTVFRIVYKYYRKYKKPIHINLIKKEIQKSGRLYSEGSLYFACYENSKIEQVNKNWFIPRREKKGIIKHEENTIDLENLDKAIRDMEKFGQSD
jgi:transcriptional regulator with XRE-family HTH domain